MFVIYDDLHKALKEILDEELAEKSTNKERSLIVDNLIDRLNGDFLDVRDDEEEAEDEDEEELEF